jgi:hypothetical protein
MIQDEFFDDAITFDNADVDCDRDIQSIIDDEYITHNIFDRSPKLQQFNDYWDDVNKWYQ